MSVVSREWYEQYMMPNYAPAALVPVRGPAPGYGTKLAASTLILPVASPSPR